MTLPVDRVEEQLPETAKVTQDLLDLWVKISLTLIPWLTPKILHRRLLTPQEFRLP